MDTPQARYFEFGEFRLDIRRRNLFKNGELQPISSRICDLLIVLLQSEGKILTHDELLDAVWAGTFVEQSNLKKSVSSLRQVLGENPSESQYIKTIPRKGYSFVAEVRSVFEDVSGVSGSLLAEDPINSPISESQLQVSDSFPTAKALLPTPNPIDQKKVPSWTVPAVVLILLTIVSFGSYWYFFGKKAVRFAFDSVETQRLTNDGRFFDSTVSPDGNYVLHSTREGKKNSLILHQLATGRDIVLASYEDVSYWSYQFTPDGNFVYYLVKNWTEPSKTGIYRAPFLGGEEKLIHLTNGGGGITLSPDGKQFAFQYSSDEGNPQIMTMSADGTGLKIVAKFEPMTRLWSQKFSPDGKSILFVIRRETPEQKNLFSVRSVSIENSTESTIIPEQERVIHSAVWTPNSESMLLLVREPNAEIRQIWQYFPGGGEWVRVTNDNESYSTLNLLADGVSIVATRDSMNSSIWTADAEPYDLRQIMGGLNQYGKANWTADGRIAYLSVDNKAEIISMMSETGRNKQQLTQGSDGLWMEPFVSEDGNSITYISNRSGALQLWKMGLDGLGQTQLTSSDAPLFNGRLMKDGKTLIYQKYVKAMGWCLFRQVGDEVPIRMTEQQVSGWDVSPDGTRIITWLEDAATKKLKLVVLDAANGMIVQNVEGAEQNILRWTPDGKGLGYVSVGVDTNEIKILPIAGGTARTVAKVQADTIFWFDWSESGKLVLVRGSRLADAIKITAKR
jgi:DNA-binding winged helix-turn-helix (wHTH) protein/Tol biopolymer transport system component